MKILDILKKDSMIPDLKAQDKIDVLNELSERVSQVYGIEQKELVKVLIEREELGSTGIGGGIGIPHGKLKDIEELALGFGISQEGIDFDSMDGRPTHIFFLLVTPETGKSRDDHLKLLANICRLLRSEVFKEKLISASDPDEIYNVIKEEDKEF